MGGDRRQRHAAVGMSRDCNACFEPSCVDTCVCQVTAATDSVPNTIGGEGAVFDCSASSVHVSESAVAPGLEFEHAAESRGSGSADCSGDANHVHDARVARFGAARQWSHRKAIRRERKALRRMQAYRQPVPGELHAFRVGTGKVTFEFDGGVQHPSSSSLGFSCAFLMFHTFTLGS